MGVRYIQLHPENNAVNITSFGTLIEYKLLIGRGHMYAVSDICPGASAGACHYTGYYTEMIWKILLLYLATSMVPRKTGKLHVFSICDKRSIFPAKDLLPSP